MLKRRIPIPQIYQGADYRLWIDRYYIAAQRLADESVRYAYLSRIHIRSELLANRNSIRKNGFALLDSEALAEFAAARRAMERYQTDYALRLSEKIHGYMCYAPGTTQINTTAMEAFQQQKGVCQDYAHILIALCRACGIPARYVNGFMQGTGVTHAWVEVLVNNEWRGIDPTNNQLIEYGYIKLAHGRDALDCRVNRGVYTGHPTEQTEIRVIVEEL